MDPISILGTAIAISTLIKDAIKLAEQIKKSVDKVPQNRKNLRKLTADIDKNLKELEKLYKERKDVLNGPDGLRVALSDLSKHMHEIHSRCCDLTVPSASSRISKLRAAFKAWSNCDAVEAEILALKDEVNTILTRFTAFGLARIEKPIFDTAAAVSRMDKQQQQGLNRMESFVAKLDFSYSQIKTAITTAPRSQDTLKITPEMVQALYLRQQIEAIASSLGSLATMQTFASEEPRGPYLKPFKAKAFPCQLGTNQSPAAHHRAVVAAAVNIVDVLEGPPGELSVQNGAWDMVNFAIQLYGLGVYSDATTIGSWAVDLYRTLLGTNAQVYEPYLALALRNLSRYKMDIGDYEGAVKDIEECVMRGRDMLKKSSKYSVRLDHSNSLIEWWSIVTQDGQLGGGLEIAQESLALLEGIRAELEEWKLLSSDTVGGTSSSEATVVEPEETDSDTPSIQGWDDVSTLWLDPNTARTYHNLSYSLEVAGRISEACERELQALTIFRGLSDRHPGIFDDRLARCLTHLASAPLSNNLPLSVSVECIQESVQLYRKLSASHPTKFTSCLIESLWECATLLHDTGEVDAAQQCSTEALDLTRKSIDDPLLLADALRQSSSILRLIKHNETAVTIRREVVEIYRDVSNNHIADLDPTTVADVLYDLAGDHIAVGQTDDAIAACTEAIRRYRLIPPSDDGSMAHLAALVKGLSYLTYIFNVAKQPSQALIIGSEALGLYRRLIADSPHLAQPYLNTLRSVGISARLANNTESIKIHAEVFKDLRILAIYYPDHVKWELVDAFYDHDYILLKHGRIDEAHLNTEELVKHLRAIPLNDPEVPSKLITALTTHAGSYAELGRVGEALLLCKEAIAIGEKHIADTDDPEIALGLSNALFTHSEWLRGSGKYDEALDASRAALAIYRRHPRDDTTILACRLHEYAINLMHINQLPEAIAVAEEAVELCRSSSSSTTFFVKIRLPYVLETLSTAVAEAGDDERAFVIIQEATDLYRKIKSNPTIAEPWVFTETLYANALVNLSSQFAARGTWEEAEAAISEATAIYKGRVVFASAYYPHLARALDLTSIQLCAAGRHEEAILAAKDLLNKKRHLDITDPEVAMLVGVALSELQGRSSQSALRQNHLQCTRCISAQT